MDWCRDFANWLAINCDWGLTLGGFSTVARWHVVVVDRPGTWPTSLYPRPQRQILMAGDLLRQARLGEAGGPRPDGHCCGDDVTIPKSTHYMVKPESV